MATLHRETAYTLLGISLLGCAETALDRSSQDDSSSTELIDFYEMARSARESSDDARLNCRIELTESEETRTFRVSRSWLSEMTKEIGLGSEYTENDDGTLNCERAYEIAVKYREAKTGSSDEAADDSANAENTDDEGLTRMIGSSKANLPSIIGIDIPASDGDFIRCSATVVARGVLATAAHCFDDTPTEHGDVFELTIHYMDKGKKGVERKLAAYPVWKNYDGLEDYQDDFALIHVFHSSWLNDKSHVLPMYVGKIKSNKERRPSKLKVYGWGMVSQESDEVARSLRTHKKKLTFSSVSPMGATTTVKRSPQICEGDSGGPWLLRGGLALTTAEWAQFHDKPSLNCMRQGDEVRASRIGGKAGWIKKEISRHKTSGKKGRCKRAGSLLRCF